MINPSKITSQEAWKDYPALFSNVKFKNENKLTHGRSKNRKTHFFLSLQSLPLHVLSQLSDNG